MAGMGAGGFPAQPDFSQGFEELIPVDAFFDNYVHQLESVAASAVHQPHDCAGPARRQQANLQHMTAEANHYQALMDTVDFDLHIDGGGVSTTAQGQQDMHAGMIQLDSVDLDGLLEEPFQPLQLGVGQQQQQQQQQQQHMMDGGGIWNQDQLALQGRASQTGGAEMMQDPPGIQTYSNPGSFVMQTGYASADASNAYVGKQATSTHSVGGSDGGAHVVSSEPMDASSSKPKRRRVRTEHQQEQNKLAQKRYRERKKQKAQHLEMTVEELAAQAEEMQRIKEQNEGLQSTKAQLESELLEKEAQIKRLNEELESSKATQVGGDDITSGGGTSVNNMSTEDLKGLWHLKMDEIRNVYEYNNLRSAKLNGEGVPEEVLGTMSMLVEEVIGVVRRLTRVEGLDMNELVNADPKGCDHLCDEQTKEIWTRVAAQCELNSDQVAKVRVLRAEHLRKLEAVYNGRQKLNLEAISVLLPANVGRGGGSIGCMSGLFSRNRNNDKMAFVLNTLKGNLKEEQRLASELEYIVLNRLLMPLQAVAFMLEAYPCYCDCLALLNGAYQVYCSGPSPGGCAASPGYSPQ